MHSPTAFRTPYLPVELKRKLRACANRLATFYTWQFSERSSRRFIGC
jgi:hypothetical protein